MAIHVAIVDQRYVQPILSGRKSVECRLTRTRRPPFGCVTPGERIYLKRSGGPFFATAVAAAVYMAADLDSAAVDRLRKAHDQQIGADPAFWRERRKWAKRVTLIWLRDVQPTDRGPAYRRRHMVAWYVLDDDAAPDALAAAASSDGHPAGFDVILTPGAVRNGYVSVRRNGCIDPACFGGRTRDAAGTPLQLDLHDGPTIQSDIAAASSLAATGRFRWRGWASWFRRCGVRPGDRLRFIPRGPRHFCVSIDRRR